jgi:hypothetical protein
LNIIGIFIVSCHFILIYFFKISEQFRRRQCSGDNRSGFTVCRNPVSGYLTVVLNQTHSENTPIALDSGFGLTRINSRKTGSRGEYLRGIRFLWTLSRYSS